ncbi:MAG: bifunctional 4'-phosphopantothenoylcysteine decarboxylase/phosphopantothenoylcysteine synthetase, partial [Pseudomonadota bacterium]|nr:bifunctional 4'-phosphopantothenoylcysteine decarboxylase/phosphopantothenoylcysteine synthetase [Pseudomonadota bacterium]
YISNHSSGKMGYALAQAALRAGATVTLISGPTDLPCPAKVKRISVMTAEEMFTAVHHALDEADIFIAAAAVTDYRPTLFSKQKIKTAGDENVIACTKNRDILASVGYLPNKPFVVGFAAETENLLEHAKEKLKSKNCDLLIANTVGGEHSALGGNENAVTVISNRQQWQWPRMQKSLLAKELIQLIAQQSSSTTEKA